MCQGVLTVTKGKRERGNVRDRMDKARWTDTIQNTVCPLYRLHEPVIYERWEKAHSNMEWQEAMAQREMIKGMNYERIQYDCERWYDES